MSKIISASQKLSEFIDYAEWIGRIPSAKSAVLYERRWAYWLIHLKQARKEKQHCSCSWHPELEVVAKRRGFPDLFQVDTRKMKPFGLSSRSVRGVRIGDISDELSEHNQTQRICVKKGRALSNIPVWTLLRMRNCVGYADRFRDFKDLLGLTINHWKLVGLVGLHGTKDTEWVCTNTSNEEGIIKRIVLPSFAKIIRFDLYRLGMIDSAIKEDLGADFEDMTDQDVGQWTVVAFDGMNKAHNNEARWFCLCGCGNSSRIAGGKLRIGASLSCGCMRKFTHSKVTA